MRSFSGLDINPTQSKYLGLFSSKTRDWVQAPNGIPIYMGQLSTPPPPFPHSGCCVDKSLLIFAFISTSFTIFRLYNRLFPFDQNVVSHVVYSYPTCIIAVAFVGSISTAPSGPALVIEPIAFVAFFKPV